MNREEIISEETLDAMRDEKLAEKVLKRCHKAVCKVLGRRGLFGVVDLDDATQSLAFKMIEDVEHVRAALRPGGWLFTTAYNHVTDMLRVNAAYERAINGLAEKHDRGESINGLPPRAHSLSPPEELELIEARVLPEDFRTALRLELSDSEWELFDLKWRHPDAPHEWLATQLGTSAGAARMMWSRILDKTEPAKWKVFDARAAKFMTDPSKLSAAAFLIGCEGPSEAQMAHYIIAREFNIRSDPWTMCYGAVPGFQRPLDIARAAEDHARQAASLAKCSHRLGFALIMQAEAYLLERQHGASGRLREKAREDAVEGWEFTQDEMRRDEMWADMSSLACLFGRLGLPDHCNQVLDFGINHAREVGERCEVVTLTEYKTNLAQFASAPWEDW